MDRVLSQRALGRALLARQGLLDRADVPVDEAVRCAGALQMQAWASLVPGVAARTGAGESPSDAHARGALVTGTLLRGTIHTVAAADHAAFVVATAHSSLGRWRRDVDPAALQDLEGEVLAAAAGPTTTAALAAVAERWLSAHPSALDDRLLGVLRPGDWRQLRTGLPLVRVPADGAWGPSTPQRHVARAVEPPDPAAALALVVRRHLAAFGPAADEDVACWTGCALTPVRAALAGLGTVTARDEAGRTLHDLPGAPLPGEDVPAPVRLLPAYDSVLLAHAPEHRTRVLPRAHHAAVFQMANGRVLPTVLVDGLVAATWSVGGTARDPVLQVAPLQPLAEDVRPEAERVLRLLRPGARSYAVAT